MQVSESDISSYIEFLIHEQHLFVSLHGKISVYSNLTRYNFHQHPYCLFVKTVCSYWDNCISRQHKVFEKCNEGEFFGTCYAGVAEFVYPLRQASKVVGFISVSGYRSDDGMTEKKQKIFIGKTSVSQKEIMEQTETLILPPEKQKIDTVIRPLVNMCEILLEKNPPDSVYRDTEFSKIIQYVNEYHTCNISVGKLSYIFAMSISSISHQFKKQTGSSLSEYIEKLRVDDAKWLLRQTKKQIVDISALLGFCNSGYFSAVFKKHCGLSPKEYRKKYS